MSLSIFDHLLSTLALPNLTLTSHVITAEVYDARMENIGKKEQFALSSRTNVSRVESSSKSLLSCFKTKLTCSSFAMT